MKITVTTTSSSLKSLLITAWINLMEIDTKKIEASNNWYWVYLEVPAGWNDVFIDNIITATTANWKTISADEAFAIDVRDIKDLNLIVASSTQDLIVLIT